VRPGIHGELLKLGIEVPQSTVAKYMARSGRGRSQTWKSFLHNHAAGNRRDGLPGRADSQAFGCSSFWSILGAPTAAADTLSMTANPTAEWIARQINRGLPLG